MCILSSRFKPGHKVFVIDAGGGTIDISSYNVTSTSPLEVEEFHEPRCGGLPCDLNTLTDGEIGFYQGGEVVTASVRAYAKGEFKTLFRARFIFLFPQKDSRVQNSTITKTSGPWQIASTLG